MALWLRDEEKLSLVLLGLLLATLCVAGGASRAMEVGQVVVRSVAIATLIILCATRRTWTLESVRLSMSAVAAVGAVCLVQLIPLPPGLWTMLPGRAPFEAAVVGIQPWRPINLTPDAGLNALLSLSVPLAALAILTAIPRLRNGTVANLVLVAIVVAALLGSLQISGGAFDNPFINETVGEAAGIFANRNHQALFLACGLPLVARWAVAGSKREERGRNRRSRSAESRRRGRVAVAAGLTIWLLLLVLATGSRAGLVLAAAGLGSAAVIAWPHLKRARPGWPRWALPVILLVGMTAIGVIVVLGLTTDRALALRRLLAAGGDADIRFSSLPLMWDLVVRYFPFGSGMGSFDPVFRIIEPFDLLAPTYLNHAHNDVVEIVIEAGIAGIALVVAAIVLWARLGLAIRHDRRSADTITGSGATDRLAGWSILSLILAASVVDYPFRTPTVMVMAVIAVWLSSASDHDGGEEQGEGTPGEVALPY